ncbi:MAG: HD domain-containing protein [Candidatus Omnitrophica bacterium]|nr:HD domain-containing protein [Candidatus Omnitrophota bacterium]MDD5429633.1 HD domain-containing protein [Candidatus Omnitrophota bacterium]
MVNKSLLLKIHEAAHMQRWNDQIRTVELTELDKQAHKMIIAYILAKCQEDSGSKGLDWIEVIEAGLFEYLQRIVLTDLKPPLFHRIKESKKEYARLNDWVYKRIYPFINPLGDAFCSRFSNYLSDSERNINRRIISAAHFYATKWEFDIIQRANPKGYLIEEIRQDIFEKQQRYHDLPSMQKLLKTSQLRDFVDICGQLRFQIRWSHLPRVPKTSVLGHMLIVAMLVYLLSLDKHAEAGRRVNNYFTGLFHDLPEVLTRDVINPVKDSVEGLRDLIKDYEKEEMEKKIYRLIPKNWHKDMKIFTEDEFSDTENRDGRLVKAVDKLAAFIEAYLSVRNGTQSQDFRKAMDSVSRDYAGKIVSGVDFGRIYGEFALKSSD